MPDDTRSYPRPTRTFSRAALLRAWERSRDASSRPGAKGIDGLTASQFNQNRDLHLARILEQLSSGDYAFSDLRPFFIRKKNGKLRVICVPTVKDRLVQRVVVDALTQKDRFHLLNSVSFGFIRGRGVRAAIEEAIVRRTNREWCLKTDIQSFFDKVNRGHLKELVRRRLRKHSLVPLICDAISCEIRASKTEREKLQKLGIHGGTGLRQGMPLSPLLSNLVLSDFDKAAQAHGFDVLRYADDLIVFGDTRGRIDDAFAFLVEELKKVGHSVPPPGPDSKTEFIDPKKPVEFLGLEIVHKGTPGRYVCRIPKSVKAGIISDIAVDNSLAAALGNGETFESLCRRLDGLPSAYRSALRQADDWSSFEPEVIGACNKALSQVFVDIFGSPAVDALNSQLRQFLRISAIARE